MNIPKPFRTLKQNKNRLGSLQEIISGGGSRSTTPTSRKSPAHDVGTQSNQSRNDQSGNNSGRDNSRRGGPRNKSQQRERKDSTKNDQADKVIISHRLRSE